jgi:HD-GYP domain-containing protein (c-di-GMP phosphodiesterase class II)
MAVGVTQLREALPREIGGQRLAEQLRRRGAIGIDPRVAARVRHLGGRMGRREGEERAERDAKRSIEHDADIIPLMQILVRATGVAVDAPDGKTLTAGRAPQCEIHVDDQSVSRRHCTLEIRGTEIHVQDLGSANGTFVNERQVERGVVRAGDLIRIGASVLEIRADSARPRGFETVMVDGPDRSYESVIQKRFEPSKFDWLSTAGGAELQLLQRAQRHLSTLHRVSELLAGAKDIQGLSDATLRAILEVTAADRAALVLRRRDPSTGEAEVAAARSRTASDAQFTVSRTLVSDVIEKGVSTFAHDAAADDRFSEGQSVIQQNIRSVMCVPLRTTDDVLGALYVDSLSGAGRFNEADLELLSAIGNQAGVALHRVRLMSELERLLLDTIRAIAATIDAKDGYTHRHSERVALLATRLGKEIALSPEELETVQLAGLLHDVGKIAVPDAILNKPGRLTPEEFEDMKKHPGHGARILENIQNASVQAVLPGVKHHHEKWDGTGYPDGLKGEDIPLLARLLGVADFFDALTSARSYRAAMSPEVAVDLITKSSGTHFESSLADLVLRLHTEGTLLPPGWEDE